MNMVINKNDNDIITTDLFEKSLALYLCILSKQSKSANSLGVFISLVFGQIFCIFSFCSHLSDIQCQIKDFYIQLNHCGYTYSEIIPLFKQATKHAGTFLKLTLDEKSKATRSTCKWCKKPFLHLLCHPQDPKSSVIEQLFHEHMLFPPLVKIRYSTLKMMQVIRLT